MHHLKRAFSSLLLICLIFSVQSADDGKDEEDKSKPFPPIQKYEMYSTDVIFTDVQLQVTTFASEYYDQTNVPRGRVDVNSMGNKKTVIYKNETNEIYEIESNTCKVWDIDESIYDYEPFFWGWLNKDPLVIGPSALLWLGDANRDKMQYLGEGDVRGIKCDQWFLNYTTENNSLGITYYFAVSKWTTPYDMGDSDTGVPLRVEITGLSNEDSEGSRTYEINQNTDFAFFRPDIPNWRVFQPPQGLGCNLKKKTKEMPKMPARYRYSAEVVDLLQSAKNEVTDIETQEIWYDSKEKLARLDKFTRMREVSELYDFNTGVTYSIVDKRSCSIQPLRYSFFEGYEGKMIGHMKTPDEVLGLDETNFYYLGKKMIRGIWADLFEAVKKDVVFMKKTLVKLVITVYYSDEYYEVNVGGETETRVPVFYAVKGWDTETHVALNMQYNIFAFDDAIYPAMYSSFRLGRCFPSVRDKSYFILVMGVDTPVAAKMEEQDDAMMLQLRGRISTVAKISDLRLPLLRADYKTTGVYVTGLMLDRPPALKQFWLEHEGVTYTSDPRLRVAPEADTVEKCAYSCVNDGKECLGIYFCNQACYLKYKDILEPADDKDNNYDFGVKCQEWLRADRDSTNKEAYLTDALKSLEKAVLDLQINISVQMSERSSVPVKVEDIVIGDGPYTGITGQDKPYNLVIQFAKLDPNDETTEALTYVDTLNDCYMACKNTEDLTCSSFSYCPDSDNKQCSISSVLVVDRKHNPDDTEDDKNCYVYSMKYLDYYDAYPGRVALIPGDDVFDNIRTAEECALKCRTAKNIACRGFEHCRTEKSCSLHTKHVLDFNPGDVITKKKTSCIHYAAKYAADYTDLGYTLVDEKIEERTEISLENCAKACSEELKDKCKSFNYCPASGPYMADSKCQLSSLILKSKGVTTTTNQPCHHYEKRNMVDDWAKANKNPVEDPSGYTSSQFTWLVVGMLIFGFVLGAVGFVVYSYYRSKGSDTGMTVRFMKQGNL